MHIFTSGKELNNHLKSLTKTDKEIGFVPTMGALHKGHLSLIERSKQENDLTLCSIFVNPLQFNNKEDLQKYPRPIEKDIEYLSDAGCDMLFLPTTEDIYPHPTLTTIGFGYLEEIMEGKFRPGHFNGVAIVISKLFHLIHPTRAYFGQKDLQQLTIIKHLVLDLNFKVEVVGCPIIRESDGLALSSRNIRIPKDLRPMAGRIYQSLLLAKESLKKESIESVKNKISDFFLPYLDFKVEYIEIVDAKNLVNLTTLPTKTEIAICIALFLNDVRLIDNLLFNTSELE